MGKLEIIRPVPDSQKPGPASRVTVTGKLLRADGRPFHLRGVTYGPFRPDASGCEYHTPTRVAADFGQMAASGINTVRVYTVPPGWLLDLAQAHGLRVMVGLPWEQHVSFLDDRGRPADIERRVREGVRACAAHPAVLCFAVGNEIPASIVRWYGPRRIERFLLRLCLAAKEECPAALVTYVNFPTTEYLRLPFLDFLCFNIYLESRQKLEEYLARLQNIAGELPLVLAEVGLDSRRNGLERQQHTLGWQISTAFAQGCAGLFVFSWTDEWHRGGCDIEDWDFGLVTRDRKPKPALAEVRRAFARVPFDQGGPWPKISVVVCSYNGARTIGETLQRLGEVDYPDYEVIVVNDGSTDGTGKIARQFSHVRVIDQFNAGLSSARNTGMRAATGEIVSYIDDDAYPDRLWLWYIAHAFRNPRHAAVGGPNLPPPGDNDTAACVANAPGGPTHVLLTDELAEHIPGCNLSIRKKCLEAIGGFDVVYRVAGDDVDVCWKLQQRGWTLGFHPAAVVWHHRRNSVKAYLRQQTGYGRAEALLEKEWPEKYSLLGHVGWAGRVYGGGLFHTIGLRWRVYYGTWGTAAFQSLYHPAPTLLQHLPQTPDWHFAILLLALLSGLGLFWSPLVVFLPLLALAAMVPLAQAAISASKAVFPRGPASRWRLARMYGLTALLFVLQPIARLRGRLKSGLTPWRHASAVRCRPLRRFADSLWSEKWRAPEEWLTELEAAIQGRVPVVHRGGAFDRWELHLCGGLLAALRLRMAIEEHGAGRQFLRFAGAPSIHWGAITAALLCAGLAAGAASDGAWAVTLLLAALPCVLAARVVREWSLAVSSLAAAIEEVRAQSSSAKPRVTARVANAGAI